MKIENNFLYGNDGKQVPFKQSPNHGGVKHPTYIIIHYTGAATASSAISWMLDPKAKVSAELHLDREGKPYQLVPFNITAWHAGVSEWKGIVGLNSHSIGIECQNTGNQEYTKAQLDALVDICKAIVAVYPIKEILGHSDIAPGRKIDPGRQFPMAWLREQVFGDKKDGVVKEDIQTTASDLNLRKGEGTSFDKIGVIPKGAKVSVQSANGSWSKVVYGGLTGYVSNQYLTK